MNEVSLRRGLPTEVIIFLVTELHLAVNNTQILSAA
jgi:hypothetical protein